MRKRAYPLVKYRLTPVDSPVLIARGRDAETLLRLVQCGERGLTAYDFAGGPPFRLSAYIKHLREAGLSIRTERAEHDCGWHARYVLETPVQIVSIAEARNEAA